MTSICVTGSTDGIGLAAARQLLADGHRVLVHARSAERGKPVLADLAGAGDARLVVGDLADLDQVRALAEDIGEVDVVVHNAGVWLAPGAPPSAQGHELTFAVNALAPHLLTAAMGDRLRSRLVFLGSGMVGSGRVEPRRLGAATDPAQAYADSKAIDVALAFGWARRRPDLLVGAVDPGWVRTKLASPGAPGDVRSGGNRVAVAAADPDWPGGYTAGARPARVPAALTSTQLQDELLAALDELAGVWPRRGS
jgi:NAD(P)-dependent dehydrogenase (short-subunit alcohol dehydrogenase family)